MQCTALLSSIVFNFSYAEVLFLDCGFVVCWGLEFLLFVLTACCVIKVASGSYWTTELPAKFYFLFFYFLLKFFSFYFFPFILFLSLCRLWALEILLQCSGTFQCIRCAAHLAWFCWQTGLNKGDKSSNFLVLEVAR